MAAGVSAAGSVVLGPARGRRAVEWAGAAALAVLLVMLAAHAVGVLFDFLAALRNPYELEPGEGVVWYQATQVPGPHAYSGGRSLPFVVFQTPPFYHLLVRMAAPFTPDMLSGGRLVSVLFSLSIVPLVAGLVVTAGRHYGVRLMSRHLAIAGMAGLLALCLHAVRTWGMFMRVDMVAVALGLAGLLLAARANGRILGTTLGLLLCVAAIYTKQSAFPAGLAVVVVTVLRKPRKGLIATGIAAAVGLVVLALLELATGGGFLRDVLGSVGHRWSLEDGLAVISAERASVPFMVLMVISAMALLLSLWRVRAPGPRLVAVRNLRLILRLLDPTMAARAILLLHFGLSTVMLLLVLRSGSSVNAWLEWLCAGCVLIGVLLCDLLADRRLFLVMVSALAVGVVMQPFRQMPDWPPTVDFERLTDLTRRIAMAPKPVASEEMSLLMRAGQAPLFEPETMTRMAAAGVWNEAPLLDMVRGHGFAFMVTIDNTLGGSVRRSPAVDAAMRVAYPRVEQVGRLWLNLPR